MSLVSWIENTNTHTNTQITYRTNIRHIQHHLHSLSSVLHPHHRVPVRSLVHIQNCHCTVAVVVVVVLVMTVISVAHANAADGADGQHEAKFASLASPVVVMDSNGVVGGGSAGGGPLSPSSSAASSLSSLSHDDSRKNAKRDTPDTASDDSDKSLVSQPQLESSGEWIPSTLHTHTHIDQWHMWILTVITRFAHVGAFCARRYVRFH